MGKNKTKRIIVAGSLIVEGIWDRVRSTDGPKARAAKQKASTAAQRRMNKIYSFKKLELMAAANFVPGDLVCTFTYRPDCLPANRKAAEQHLKYFRAKLSKQRAAAGQELRMIWNTESRHGEGRYHHHCIINSTGEDYDCIRQLWIYGIDVDIKPLVLDRDHSYESLARYMCKEEPEYLGQRSWSCTRNCHKPEVETFRVEDDTQIQPPKGATVLEEISERTEYGYYKIVKYLAPGWEQHRVKSRRRR